MLTLSAHVDAIFTNDGKADDDDTWVDEPDDDGMLYIEEIDETGYAFRHATCAVMTDGSEPGVRSRSARLR